MRQIGGLDDVEKSIKNGFDSGFSRPANQMTSANVPFARKGTWRFFVPWALYDFGNSILVINGGLYFPQWLVIDHQVSDFWFNLSIPATALLVLVIAPYLGARSDIRTDRWQALWWTTCGMIGSALLLSFVATQFRSHAVVYFGLAMFVAVNSFYLLSLVLYNALLADFVLPEQTRLISGVGLAAGWVGAIVGLVAVTPFVNGHFAIQDAGRANAFLPAAVLAAAVLFPSLLLLRRNKRQAITERPQKRFERDVIRDEWRHIRGSPILRSFYIFFFIAADAFGTIQQNMPIYLERVLSLSDSRKALLLGLVLLSMAVGGVLSGIVGRSKPLNKVISAWVVASGASLLWFASVSTFRMAMAAGIFVGMTMGGTFALMRALAIALIPAEARGAHFGLYSALDRISALLGPVVWSAIIVVPLGVVGTRSRIALALFALLVLSSNIFARRVVRA